MASINGVQIKSYKTFRGHDGCAYAQGMVYYNGKKLGSWSQDAWCGPDHFDFNEDVLLPVVNKYRESDKVEEKFKAILNLECLLGDLANLMDTEKQYKKCVKSGYSIYVEAHGRGMSTGWYFANEDALKEDFSIISEQAKKRLGADVKISVYRKPEDFDLVV